MIDYTTNCEQIITCYKLLFENLRSCNHLIFWTQWLYSWAYSDCSGWGKANRKRKKKTQYTTQSRVRKAGRCCSLVPPFTVWLLWNCNLANFVRFSTAWDLIKPEFRPRPRLKVTNWVYFKFKASPSFLRSLRIRICPALLKDGKL